MTSSARGRVVFVGSVHEALPAAEAVLGHPDAQMVGVVTADTSTTLSGAVDLRSVSERASAPLLRVTDINDPAVVRRIARLSPDLLVVAGWTRLLGADLLAVPRYGCVGFHASLLPHNRGRAPVNWAIIRGEATTGNTMMLLDPGVDTGDIVDQRVVSIEPDDTCATIYERVAETGKEMLTDHLSALLSGEAPRRAQPPSDEPPLPRRTPEMGAIDWSAPAHTVHDWVRALTVPYPGAFGTLRGRRVMVWRTRLAGAELHEPPGTLRLDNEGIVVACGVGSVRVTSISWAGEPPVSATEWATDNALRSLEQFTLADEEEICWARGVGARPASLAGR